MSNITPKTFASGAGATPGVAAPAAARTATAAEIPAAVANLSLGTVVSGTVIERNPRGLVVLRTDKGTIKLQSAMPLKLGSMVTLQIQSLGTQVQLSILSVDGQSLGHAAATPPPSDSTMKPAIDPAGARAQGAAQSTTSSTAIGETHEATLPRAGLADRPPTDRPSGTIAPSSTAGAFVARPLTQIHPRGFETLSSPAPTGAPVTPAQRATALGAIAGTTAATMASGVPSPPVAPPAASTTGRATPPAPPAPQTAITSPPTAAALGGEAAPTTQPLSAAGANPPSGAPGARSLPAGPDSIPLPDDAAGRLIARLLGAAPSRRDSGVMTTAPPAAPATASLGASSPTVAPTQASAIATGVPTATTAVTIVPLPATTTTLASPSHAPPVLPAADPVALRIPGEPLAQRPAAFGWPLAPAAQSSTPSWPALRSLMTAIEAIGPGAVEHLANVTLPRIGPNLAVGMMAFVTALRQGNPRAWLGDQTVEALQRAGQHGAIDRLADEFAAVSRYAADSGTQNWQTLLLPLYDGERLEQLRLYWQRQNRKPGARKGGMRFIVEAHLTNFGVLQLDGAFEKPQFDLVVRSAASLTAQVRADIAEIFGDAMLATGLKGTVNFQIKADLRAGPPDEPGAGAGLIV